MDRFLKNILTKFSPPISSFLKIIRLLYHKDSYLKTTGLYHSYKKGFPVNRSGEPFPWMNYSMIAFLENRLKKDLYLFEFGSGYSTLFYSKFVAKVVSIESDKIWFEKLSSIIPDNVELLYKEFVYDGDYCRSVNDTEDKFDVIIIDGRDRVRCAKNCLKNISNRGVIIFDDTDREQYNEAVDYFLNSGFRKIDIEGLKAGGFDLHKATIFYKNNNCLGI